MQEFSLSELNRRSGEIVDQALSGPVLLTKHGRPQLVLMSVKEYGRLTTGAIGSHEDASMEVSTAPSKSKLAALTRIRETATEYPDEQ